MHMPLSLVLTHRQAISWSKSMAQFKVHVKCRNCIKDEDCKIFQSNYTAMIYYDDNILKRHTLFRIDQIVSEKRVHDELLQ